jgi:Anthrone oxygenase
MYRVAKLLSLMSTGFLAGVFTYALFTIIPAWNEVPRTVHFTYRVALMRHNAVVMQSIMAVGILAPLWWAWTIRAMPAARTCAVAAGIMNLTAVLVTRFGNVPINQLVRKWLTAPPPANYLETLHRWTVFNNVRSAAAVFGFVLILLADALMD